MAPDWLVPTAGWVLVALVVIGIGWTFLRIAGGGEGLFWHVLHNDEDEETPTDEDDADDTFNPQ